jgi:phosphohistidine phosphatase
MNLYLIRHAIAVDEGAPEYADDSQRPLTDKGKKKMRQVAKGLRALGVEFDLILSSPYARATGTADVLADVFKMKKEIQFSDNLVPMGDPELLIAEMNEKYMANSVALVGHEPFLSALIGLLVSENTHIDMTMKKGGVCRLSADDLHHTRKATLEWLLMPGILVEIATIPNLKKAGKM